MQEKARLDNYYQLVLQLKDRMAIEYDPDEYEDYTTALTVAIFVAKYGYPFGEKCIPVVLVQVVHVTKEMSNIRGAWLSAEDYEEYQRAGLIKL